MPLSPDDEAAFQALATQFFSDPAQPPTGQDLSSLVDDLKETAARRAGAPWMRDQDPRPCLRRPPLSTLHRYTLRIDLHRSHPPIWRRLEVRSDISLHTLHLAIQGAFNWANAHLYRFALGHPFDRHSELFLCEWDSEEGDSQGTPAADVRLDETLQQSGELLQYVYDYGDDWGLRIRLEKVSDATPDAPEARCTGGRRAAPPEDCGSLRTAEALAEVVDDPASFDFEEANELITDYLYPEPLRPLIASDMSSPDHSSHLQRFPAFRDLVRLTPNTLDKLLIISRLSTLDANPLYREAVSDPDTALSLQPSKAIDERALDLAAEFESLLWLLNRVGNGIKLTQAGYLPPTVAREFAEVLHSDEDLQVWTGSSESQLRQLAAYRKYLHRLGLLQKSRGMLLLTKAGSAARHDPAALWDHLIERFAAAIEPVPGERDFDRDAAALTLLHAATSGGDLDMEQAAEEMSATGRGYTDGSPIHFTGLTWGRACPAVLFWFMGPRAERRWHARRIRPAAVALAHSALTRE